MGEAGLDLQMTRDPLFATSEAQHAVRWSVVDGDQPGVPRFLRMQGSQRRTPPIDPGLANLESRSATVPSV